MKVTIKAGQTAAEFNAAIWKFLTPIAMKRDWVYQRAYGKNVDVLGGFGSIAHSAASSLHAGKSVELSVSWSLTETGHSIQRLFVDEV